MAFSLKVSTDKEMVKDSQGGAFISNSGVYDVKINFVSLEESKNGAISFNMNVDYQGQPTVIYGSNINNNDGSENAIGRRLLNSLLVIAGLQDGQEPTIDEETHKVGKDQTPTEFNVITDLSDIEVKIQIKQEFTMYNGNIREERNIYKFFREDGASAEEVTEQLADPAFVVGKQLEATLAREATTQPFYKGNKGTNEPAPTPAEVTAWIAAKKAAKGGKPAPKAKPAAGAKKSPFAK